jgi:hypothetical protein
MVVDQPKDEGFDPEEIINKLVQFLKDRALAQEEELLGTNDFIRDLEIERTNIRCISTSILTICGFLLPILFGIFYFIVKDSSNIHINIPPLLIVILILSILFLFASISFSVLGIRASKPDASFLLLTKLDKYNYLDSKKESERTSSERSIIALAFSVLFVIITFTGIYYCIATTPNNINEISNATLNLTSNATAINISLR